MNIAFDARALVGPVTGVGTWTTQVAAGLAGDPSRRVVLAASKPVGLPEELALANVEVLPPPGAPWPGTLWMQWSLPGRLAAARTDVFIGSLGILPRRSSVPGVLMVHDLTPRTHPSRHTLANRFCFNTWFEPSLEVAAAVVVGSAATQADLLREFPQLAARVRVISYGVSDFFSPGGDDGESEEVRRQFSSGRPYILHLGTLEPRKGVRILVEAWEQLADSREDCPDLVLAGAPGWGIGPILDRIRRSPRRERIHQIGYVSREHALALLRHASVFVLASEAEGFGLPLAEAICCETACVASDIPSLRECGAEAVVYTRPNDAGGLAVALERAMSPEVRQGLQSNARARRRSLRWAPVIEAWSEVVAEVAGGRSSAR